MEHAITAAPASPARDTVVRLDGEDFVGSGFFVAPGLILTCAHVVDGLDTVQVRWKGFAGVGTVVERRPADRAEQPYWPFPDLALVRLPEAPPHPCAWFDDHPPRTGDEVVAFGYSRSTPSPDAAVDTLRLVTVGDAAEFVRLQEDQVVPGMSGSLALNTRTNLVTGIVKASRDRDAVAGGWIVPAPVIRREIGEHLPRDTDRRPDDPWLAARIVPLAVLLEAQSTEAQELPYQLLDPPVPRLSEIYVQPEGEARQGRRSTAQTVLRSHRNVVLVGEPGSGKSSLLRQVCAETARWWLTPDATPPPHGRSVAVRLNAVHLASDASFTTAIARGVQANLGGRLDDELDGDLFEQPVAPTVDWLVLIDGLDEIIDSGRRRQVVEEIARRTRAADVRWRFVVTTRPLQVSELDVLDRGSIERYSLCLFDRPRIDAFVDTWFRVRRDEITDPRKTPAEFRRWIAAAGLGDLLRNPLMVTLAVIVFEIGTLEQLPSTVTGVYDEFVRTLLQTRRERLGYDHELATRLVRLGPGGEEAARLLIDSAEEMLQAVAHEWYFDSTSPIVEIADRWCRGRLAPTIVEHRKWRAVLRAALVQTGVLVEANDDLQWLHLSLAESLASRRLAAQVELDDWRRFLTGYATRNLVRLTLLRLAEDPQRQMAVLRSALENVAHREFAVELLRLPNRRPTRFPLRRARCCVWLGGLLFTRFGRAQLGPLSHDPAVAHYLGAVLGSRWITSRRKAVIVDDADSYLSSAFEEAVTLWAEGALLDPAQHPRTRAQAVQQLLRDRLRGGLRSDLMTAACAAVRDERQDPFQLSLITIYSRHRDVAALNEVLAAALLRLGDRANRRRRFGRDPLRDILWAAQGLVRLGHDAEARAILDAWYRNGRPVSAVPSWHRRQLSELAEAVGSKARPSEEGEPAEDPSDALRSDLKEAIAREPERAREILDEAAAAPRTVVDLIWLAAQLHEAGDAVAADRCLDRLRRSDRGATVRAALGQVEDSPRVMRPVLVALIEKKAVSRRGAARLRTALAALGGVPPELRS